MRSMILTLALALAGAACWSSPNAREQQQRQHPLPATGPAPARSSGASSARGEPHRDAAVRAPPATACPVGYGATEACTPAEPRSVVVRERTNLGQGPGPIEAVAALEWPRCTYPQGTCQCLQGPQSCGGGAAVGPAPAGWTPPPFRWVCTAATRADGCPGAPPHEGEPCTVAHTCGYCITLFQCDQGKWSVPIVGPPPP